MCLQLPKIIKHKAFKRDFLLKGFLKEKIRRAPSGATGRVRYSGRFLILVLVLFEAFSFVTVPREPWALKRESPIVSLVGAPMVPF